MDERAEARAPKKTKTLDRANGLVSGLLILLPAVFGFLYVHAFGVNVVFSDAWSIVPLLGKWSSGTLQISDLLQQHNEHRMFFPEGVEVLLGSITNYNNVVEMYLIQACLFVTLIGLLLVFRDNIGSWLFLFVPVSLLIFSFRQYENLLFGYQINFAFAEMFSVLALLLLYFLRRGRFAKTAFIAALISATVAAFSVLQGLFVWPAGLLQLLISPIERSRKRSLISLWSLTGLLEWIGYFIDYKKPKGSPSLLYALGHPVAGIEYFLNLLGSSLFWRQSYAFLCGLLLVCFILASLSLIFRYRRLGEYSFWISLLFFSLLILASISAGRSGYGVEQAMASRYTAFSILAVVSVYAMLVKMALERRSVANTGLLVVLSGVILLSAAISYSRGLQIGNDQRIAREQAAFVLATYESQPDAALTDNLNPRVGTIRDRAPVLQNLGYNVFSKGPRAQGLPPPLSGLSPVASTTSSGIDSLNTDAKSGAEVDQQSQSIVIPKDASSIQLAGWAVDTNNKSAAGGVYIDVDGKPFPAFYGVERPNIADYFGAPSYRYSGFVRYIPVSEIGAGTHELSIVVLTADGRGYYQPDRKATLDIR